MSRLERWFFSWQRLSAVHPRRALAIRLAVVALILAIFTRSVLGPVAFGLAFWPALVSYALLDLWAGPAVDDYLREIEWTSPGYRDTITPVILLFRHQRDAQADRLRRVARKRIVITIGVFALTVVWWVAMAGVAALFRL